MKVSQDSKKICLSRLKYALRKSETFKKDYDKWEQLVAQEANKIDFYQSNTKLSKFSRFSIKIVRKMVKISIYSLIVFVLGFLISLTLTESDFIIIITIVAFFIHIIMSILSIIIYDLRLPIEYLNEIGIYNLKKWKGFINFLKEYTMIHTRKAEEVYLWEEYLVYGVAFGIAKNVINDMDQAYGFNSYIKKD